MTDGLNSILTYVGANYVLIVLAAAAFCLWREAGAAAVGGVGQFFVNASSSPWHHLVREPAQYCANLWLVVAISPIFFFAVLPAAFNEISQRWTRREGAIGLSLFSSLFFAAMFANSLILALCGASRAAGAVSGPLLLSFLLAIAAITMSKLGKRGHNTPEAAVSDFGSFAHERSSGGSADCATAQAAPDSSARNDHDSSRSLDASRVNSSGKPAYHPPAALEPRWSLPPVTSPAYLFNKNEFYIFRAEHLKGLEDLFRREPPGVLEGLQIAICLRLGRVPVNGDQRGFVRAYVTQFRKRIKATFPTYFFPDRFDLAAA